MCLHTDTVDWGTLGFQLLHKGEETSGLGIRRVGVVVIDLRGN